MHKRVIYCGETSKSNWMLECDKERLVIVGDTCTKT